MSVLRDFYDFASNICLKTIPNYLMLDKTRLAAHDVSIKDVTDSWLNYRIPQFSRQMTEFVETKIRPEFPEVADLCLEVIQQGFVRNYSIDARSIRFKKDWTDSDKIMTTLGDEMTFVVSGSGFLGSLERRLGLRLPYRSLSETKEAEEKDWSSAKAMIGDYGRPNNYDSEAVVEEERRQRKKAKEEEEEEAKKKLSGGFRPYRQAMRPYRVSFF